MSLQVKSVLEQMTTELGERKDKYWFAEFSVKDVLSRLGKKNTQIEQNYVRYIVEQNYPGSKIFPGQGDNGGFIHMRIRSI